MIKKIFLLLLIFVNSCGYEAAYLNKDINFQFSKISSEGDININKKIINILSFKESKNDKSLNELSIKSSFNNIEASRNTKGQVETYKSYIIVDLEIKKENKFLKKKTFKEDFIYSKKQNKFDLVRYQNDIKKNLIEKVSKEIVLYINLK